MCLTLGVNLSNLIMVIKLVLYSQYISGALVCSAKSYVYLQVALVFLTAL